MAFAFALSPLTPPFPPVSAVLGTQPRTSHSCPALGIAGLYPRTRRQLWSWPEMSGSKTPPAITDAPCGIETAPQWTLGPRSQKDKISHGGKPAPLGQVVNVPHPQRRNRTWPCCLSHSAPAPPSLVGMLLNPKLMLAQTHFPAPAAPFHYKDTELSASPSD